MENNIKELAESAAFICKNNIIQVLNSVDWTETGTKKGIKCYQRYNEGQKVLLGVCFMEFPIEIITNYLIETRNKAFWEPLLVNNSVIFDNGDWKIIHEVFKAPWPVSKRDFVFVAKKEDIGEDVLLVGKSIDIGLPEGQGIVRGECIMSGFYLKKMDNGETEVKYLVCIDPKGKIPLIMANFAANQQLMCLERIRYGISASLQTDKILK